MLAKHLPQQLPKFRPALVSLGSSSFPQPASWPWGVQPCKDVTQEGETRGKAQLAAQAVSCGSRMKGQAYLQSTEQLMEAGNGLEDLLRENRSTAVTSHWVLGTWTAPSPALCPTSGPDKLHSSAYQLCTLLFLTLPLQ